MRPGVTEFVRLAPAAGKQRESTGDYALNKITGGFRSAGSPVAQVERVPPAAADPMVPVFVCAFWEGAKVELATVGLDAELCVANGEVESGHERTVIVPQLVLALERRQGRVLEDVLDELLE